MHTIIFEENTEISLISIQVDYCILYQDFREYLPLSKRQASEDNISDIDIDLSQSVQMS